MIKQVQLDINGIYKIKFRFEILKEKKPILLFQLIQYLFMNTTSCVCHSVVLSAPNVIKYHILNSTLYPEARAPPGEYFTCT